MFGGFMDFININAKDVEMCLKQKNIAEYADYYRKYIYFGEEDVLGLYYKEFINLDKMNEKSIEKHISSRKNILSNIDEWTWEHHTIESLFKKINRIVDAQKEVPCKLDDPVITGIALCDNYPVGVLFPMKILSYKTIGDLENEGISLSMEDKEMIMDQVELWVKSLVKHNVYPSLYFGNILINPDDYSDVILDGLDGPSICRVENEKYTRILAERGRDLKEEAYREFNKLKESFLRKENARQK